MSLVLVDEEEQAENTRPTGLPTITGTAQVGQTLTALTNGISDTDGLDNVDYSYQWLADDTDIAGATDSTYTPSVSDVGKTVKVRVTFTDDADNEETLTSEATVAVAAKPTPRPRACQPSLGHPRSKRPLRRTPLPLTTPTGSPRFHTSTSGSPEARTSTGPPAPPTSSRPASRGRPSRSG